MSDASWEVTADHSSVELPPTMIVKREVATDNVINGDNFAAVPKHTFRSTLINAENKHHPDMKSEDNDKNLSLDSTILKNKEILLKEAKKEFHSKRHLILKNVSPNASEEDIRKVFESMLEIKDITINRASQTGKITLLNPELLERWPTNEVQYEVVDQLVTVKLSDTEGMLCVAHLPFIYTEDDFRNLVQMYGPVASCFLCRSEKSGEHKGYGFVEYSSRDVAFKAKPLLEQKILGDCQFKCCWLEPSNLTYSSLHSKCLFVDHLPTGYRDLVEFRKIFSVVSSPSYCQIGIKNNQPLGFGLVEFDQSDDAEDTQKLLNHSKLGDHQIRVTFCAPGYRAMVIYNKLTSGMTAYGKQPLLPDPPKNSDVNQMSSNGSLYQNQTNGICNGRNWENVHRNSNGNFNDSQLPLGSAASNSSLQEAVILLLTAQVQSQMGMQQSPLNNSQSINMILQALGQQPNETQDMTESLRNIAALLQQANGQSRCQVPHPNGNANNNCTWQAPNAVEGKAYNKVPLLPDPPCLKQTDSGGLLPTPSMSKLHPNAFCNGQGNFMNSALHNGNPQQPLFVKTPYENQGRQKVPLLGEKPSNVPLSGPNAVGPMDRCTFPILSSSNSNSSDANALAQLLAPLIMKQNQALQSPKFSKVNENLVYQQPKNGNGITGAPPALVNLLLQSLQRLQQQGDINKTTMPNQNGFQFPLNISYPSPNFFLGASTLAQKQILFGSSPLVSPPPLSPTRPSHVLTMSPPGAPKQPVFTQPFIFPTQSQNGLQAGSLAAAQLMAEIQQRGSLLGDFWQASLGGTHFANHFANGKMAAPLITNVGYPGLAKRKLAFPPEVTNVGEMSPMEQLKKRRI